MTRPTTKVGVSTERLENDLKSEGAVGLVDGNGNSALGIGKKVFRNTLWNILGKFAPMIVQFFLTPFLTSSIGNARFGIWTYAFMIANYAMFLDFGFSAGLMKFVAEDHAKGDCESLSSTVSTGLVFYSMLSIVINVLIWIFAVDIARAMRLEDALLKDAIFAVRGAAVALLMINLLDIAFSVLDGIQRMDASAIVRVVQAVLTVIGTVIVLKMGFGLRGLIANVVIVASLSALVAYLIAFVLIPGLRILPSRVSMKYFKRLGAYGLKMQISTIAGAITTQFDKFLSGYLISIVYLAFYQIGSQVTRAVQMLPMTAVGALMPAASAVDALDKKSVLRTLYERGSKYLLVVSIPIAAAIFCLGDSVIHVWMGSGYEISSHVMKVLSVAYLFNIVTTGCGTAIVRGIGKPGNLVPYALTSMGSEHCLGIHFRSPLWSERNPRRDDGRESARFSSFLL